MKYLTPLPLKEKYYKDIEKTIEDIFYRAIYEPISKVLRGTGIKEELQLKNAADPLLEAIASGQIYYDNGNFYGRFNSTISKDLSSWGGSLNRVSADSRAAS